MKGLLIAGGIIAALYVADQRYAQGKYACALQHMAEPDAALVRSLTPPQLFRPVPQKARLPAEHFRLSVVLDYGPSRTERGPVPKDSRGMPGPSS
jgi:hypothetical protein